MTDRDGDNSARWLVQWGAPESDGRGARRLLEQPCGECARVEAQQEQSRQPQRQSVFVVFPTHRRVKARKVIAATRRLDGRYAAWQRVELSFADFDASVQGWINHVRYADSWGLRTHVLSPFVF